MAAHGSLEGSNTTAATGDPALGGDRTAMVLKMQRQTLLPERSWNGNEKR